MADQNYWFPNESGDPYDLPSGDTMKFCIYYDDGGGASDTDTDAMLHKLKPLDMPFEITPSSAAMRFASMGMVFHNTDDVFEDEDILNETYKDDTYIDVYLNGSIIWRGMIDFKKIKKTKWYLDDAGDLIYPYVEIKAIDVLSYFWTHSGTLSGAGASTQDELDTVMEAVFAVIDYSPSDIVLDTNFEIDEDCGTSYTWDTLYLLFSGGQQISVFLKDIIIKLGVFIYNWNGKMYVVLRNGGTEQTITNANLLEGMKVKENLNPIEFTKVAADLSTIDEFSFPGNITAGPISYEEESGTESDDSNKNIDIDATGILDEIFSIATGTANSGNLITAVPPDTGGTTSLTDVSETFLTDLYESGDIFEYRDGTWLSTLLESVPAETQITWYDVSRAIGDNEDYALYRGYDGTRRWRYKIMKMVELVESVYADYFLTSPDILFVKLSDITTFLNLHYRFTILSTNHRIKSAKIYFDVDELSMDLVQVT